MAVRFFSLVRNPSFWWSLVLVWFIALFIISSLSRLPPGPQIANIDKIQHTVYYALGASWFYLARRFGRRPATSLAACLGAILFSMVVGAFDEFHQSFVPNRSGNDLFDWLADTLGGFVGALIGWIAYRMIKSPADSPA